MSNPLWDYSCAVYARGGVSGLCLQLQDGFDFDVNLLLYCAWLGSEQRELTMDHLQALDTRIAPFREEVIKPMRTLRRELKALPATLASGEELQVLELDAEQQQQQLMYEFFRGSHLLQNDRGSVALNLAVLGRYYASTVTGWEQQLADLASLIEG